MEKYEGMDESTLKEMLENATSYDDRSEIRRALRKLKNAPDSRKKVGSANYRRAGYQARITMAIPNSVTGNVLPNKVSTENLSKTEVPKSSGTVSFLKSKGATPSSKTSPRGSVSSPRESVSSPRGSVSSAPITPEPGMNDRKDSAELANEVEDISEPQVEEPQVEDTRSPTPPPPRDPTPPPPREPTPPPPREPTPPPPREPTPEPTPEPVEEEEEEVVEEEVVDGEMEEEEEEEQEEEQEEEEEEEEEEEPVEGVKVSYDDSDEEDRSGRVFSPSSSRQTQDKPSKAAAPAKNVVPMDVLTKKEEGIEGGDFRKRLQKASNTKISTTSAFPQAKPKGEQVDFRNVLRKANEGSAPAAAAVVKKAVNTVAAFPQARQKGDQIDFRNVLRKVDSKEPSAKPRQGRQQDEDEEEVEEEEARSPTPDNAGSAGEEVELEESLESAEAAPQEEEEDEVVGVSPDQTNHQEEVEEEDQSISNEVDIPSPSPFQDENSYEARQAERKRKREQRRKELAAIMDDTRPAVSEVSSPPPPTASTSPPPTTNGTSSPATNGTSAPPTNGTDEPDSYEARKEARRKAREERLKAASRGEGGDDKPKMSYKDKKAMEARKNAKDSRKQWENRDGDSGSKTEAKAPSFKKKDSATQQLLAWCQHKTKYYENVNIKDFRSSWADGLAFCAIMHSFLPDKIPFDDLKPEERRKNFTLAFDCARDEGIPEMLDVEDMVTIKVPDAKSIMTFLVTIYQHFNS